MSEGTPIYNLKILSEKLNVGIRTLRRYIQRGELKAKKVGRAYYVTESNLMRFLEPESSQERLIMPAKKDKLTAKLTPLERVT